MQVEDRQIATRATAPVVVTLGSQGRKRIRRLKRGRGKRMDEVSNFVDQVLYDTICARLDPTFNYNREYNRYGADAMHKSRKRVRRAVQRRLDHGLTDSDYASLEALASTANEGLYRLRRLFTAPYDFLQLPYAIEKWVFTVMLLVQLAVRVTLVTAGITGVILGLSYLIGSPLDAPTAFGAVVTNPWYRLAILVLVVVHLRLVLFRMADKTRTL